MKNQILEDVLSQVPSTPLYHYTRQSGFIGIIEKKEIWATHTQYLNDQREYLHALDMVRNRIRELSEAADKAGREILDDMELGLSGIETMNVCICSFSAVRDSLPQWRAYGTGSSGFAIGFSGADIAKIAQREQWYLAPCIYNPNGQHRLVDALVQEVFEQNLNRKITNSPDVDELPAGGNLNAYLHRYAPILKDSSFQDEQEWRLISRPLTCRSENFSFREGPSMLVPYFKFPLIDSEGYLPIHEVVVGPTPHPEQSKMSATSFLIRNHRRRARVPVESSRVPYRTW
jgi:hypothetical protein